MGLILRYMTVGDIPQVTMIDHAAFDTPWSAQSYLYEIRESRYTHMAVLEDDRATYNTPPPTNTLWRRLRSLFSGINGGLVESPNRILGYGGLWHIMDEAHISTIATHPESRGCGYGEALLAGMIQRSITLRAAYLVLEVRVSNIIAQNLYKKYEFTIQDVKKNYYRNNREDAYDMRLSLSDPAVIARLQERFRAVQNRLAFADQYSAGVNSLM